MEKLTAIFMSILMAAGFSACSGNNGTAAPSQPAPAVKESEEQGADTVIKADGKNLVVYFSASGNTARVAQLIADETNADTFELIPKEPYSSADLNYADNSSRVVYEHDHEGARNVELESVSVQNWESYDNVFIGYPIWWHIAAWPVDSFVKGNDFSGKTVIPFCTSASSGPGESGTLLADMAGTGRWLAAERFSSGVSADDIRKWTEGLGITAAPADETVAAAFTSAVATAANSAADVTEPADKDGKTLIVYFSWSGNTTEMAETIAGKTGGELFELVPVNPYPEEYTPCTEVALEERDSNARPEIKDLPDTLDGYDTILIGYPIWWHTAPMIIGTFLENYDLTGIDVYPFTQSASMDEEQFENSMDFVRSCAGSGNVHDGLFVRADDEAAIEEYLKNNGLTD